ncbi:hypothetical protein LCGC14_2107420 [marine sediment metagenome]|uniref:Uncharacterized protein n=1 Tax=marine sediment metagenome TaxID=412755 RepID=A0A0F9E897_9ZZZZ
MTEEVLFEIMRQEFPQDGDTSFCLNKDHWMFKESGEEIIYQISIVPVGKVEQFSSKNSWGNAYKKYLAWKEDSNDN